MSQEGETVVLKESIVDDVKKEIVAFANSMGGTLYVGVADDGSILLIKGRPACSGSPL